MNSMGNYKVKDLLSLKSNIIIMLNDDTTCVYDDTVNKVPDYLLNKEVSDYSQIGNNHLRIVLI